MAEGSSRAVPLPARPAACAAAVPCCPAAGAARQRPAVTRTLAAQAAQLSVPLHTLPWAPPLLDLDL